MASGQALVALCKTHILETMASLPECSADGPGLGNKAIEEAAGFELHLAKQDGWFTWSLLFALVDEGAVEVVLRGKSRRRFRLAGT
jgi:hypothetical protein